MCEFAEHDFKKVVEVEPLCLDGHLGLAKVLMLGLNYPLASRACDAALKIEPDNPTALLAKGRCFLETRKPIEASRILTKRLELGEDGEARRSRAEAHVRLHNYVEAIADLDASLELEPEAAGALLTRGWLYLQLGELDYAAEDFTASLSLESRRLESSGEGKGSDTLQLASKYERLMKARQELQAGGFERCRSLLDKLGGGDERRKPKVWEEEEIRAKEADLLDAPLLHLVRGVTCFCDGDHPIAVKHLTRAAQEPGPEAYQKAAPCVVGEPSLPPWVEQSEVLRCVARVFVMGNTHQFDIARSLCSKALEKMPASGPIRVLRAVLNVNLVDINRDKVFFTPPHAHPLPTPC